MSSKRIIFWGNYLTKISHSNSFHCCFICLFLVLLAFCAFIQLMKDEGRNKKKVFADLKTLLVILRVINSKMQLKSSLTWAWQHLTNKTQSLRQKWRQTTLVYICCIKSLKQNFYFGFFDGRIHFILYYKKHLNI